MNAILEEASAVRRQFGPCYQWSLHTSKFYPSGGITPAGVNLLAYGQGQVDADDTRTTPVVLTEEESNFGKSGQMEYDFIARAIRCELHLAPKARQHASVSGDADGIVGAGFSVQDVLHRIMQRGLARLTVNKKERAQLREPFLQCPPVNVVVPETLGVAQLASQVNQFWVTQDPDAPLYKFPDLLHFRKGDIVKLQLEMPDGASPSIASMWTNGTYTVTPVILMRTYLDGWRIN